MALVKVTLRDQVRNRCGNPKKEEPTELSDASIEEELDAALRILDRYVPNWLLYSLTTEDTEQLYTVESGVSQVLKVYWFGTSDVASIFGGEFDAYFGIPLYDVETGYYNWCLDWLTQQRSRGYFDWEFNQGSQKIYLIPAPSQDDISVWYVGAKPWTWDTVCTGRQDVIIGYAVGECLKILGRSRSKLSGVMRSGGLIDYGAEDALTKDGRLVEEKIVAQLEAESYRWMALT